MLHAFGHLVATCYDMLRIENRTSAHVQAQCQLELFERQREICWSISLENLDLVT